MRPRVRAFLKAAWWGGLAAGGLPLLFTIPFGFFMLAEILRSGEPVGLVWLLPLAPLVISVPVTGLCLAIIGIPVAVMLERQGGFSQGHHAAVGAAIGGILMIISAIYFGNEVALALPLFGSMGGSVAAAVWYSARVEMVREQSAD